MSAKDPMFAGQMMVAYCEKAGRKTTRIAKMNNGDLQWWCNHGKNMRPRAIIKRTYANKK